jgi:hypothetical protein
VLRDRGVLVSSLDLETGYFYCSYLWFSSIHSYIQST